MKRLLLSAFVAAALWSCAESDVEGIDAAQQGDQVALRLTSGIATRVQNSLWEGDETIGVTMYKVGTDEVIGNRNIPYITDDKGAEATFEPYAGFDDIFYPKEGDVDIVAFYLFAAVNQNATQLYLDLTEQGEPEAIDLLWAKATQVSKSREAVELEFRHVMSSISLNITVDSEGGVDAAQLHGAEVTVGELATQATFDIASGALEIDPAVSGAITMYGELSAESSSKSAIILPQSFTPTFTITTDGGETFSVTASEAITFEAATQHQFNIKVSYVHARLTASITDWDEQEQDGLSVAEYSLADFEDPDFVPTANTWVISGNPHEVNYYDGLKAAIATKYDGGNGTTTSLIFPDLTAVVESLFQDCGGLKSVDMPAATSIGNLAFSGCLGLVSVDMPAATSIGNKAFANCTSLVKLKIGYDEQDHNYTDIEGIGEDWLSGLSNDKIAKIHLFLGSILPTANPTIVVTNNTIEIGSTSFTFNSITKGVKISDISETSYPEGDEWTFLQNRASEDDFEGLRAAINAKYNDGNGTPTSLIFPNLKTVPWFAFSNCEGLVGVDMPAATDLNRGAFSHCSALVNVSLPAVTNLGTYVFESCTALESVSLPAAASIGGSSFANCTALVTLKIGYKQGNHATITNISENWLSRNLFGSVYEDMAADEVAEITLYIGNFSTANPEISVRENTLTIGTKSLVFNNIIQAQ